MRYFYAKYIKRFIDIVISLLGLIILSPVMLVVAVLVGKKLGKPVIYKQQRPGYKEKIFCRRHRCQHTARSGVGRCPQRDQYVYR